MAITILFELVLFCLSIHSSFAFIGFFELTSNDDDYFYYYGSGSGCTVSSTCFYSPNYPADYPPFAFCDITVIQNGTLTVESFETEAGYDYLQINDGFIYYGDIGPEGVKVTEGDQIYFSSDISNEFSGFAICVNISFPSSQPTPVPTPAPTPVCDRGAYVSSVTHTCTPCEAGRYSNTSFPNSNCTACSAGYYQADTGSTSCIACSSGLSTQDRTDCRACVAGEYAFDNIECVPCESGRYAPTAQVDSCLECYAGDATNNITGATACSACDAGTYSQDLATTCIDCLAGTYSSERASSCVDCDAGKYSGDEASSTCTECLAGTVSNTSASVCVDCAAGRSQSLSGQSTCSLCAAGTYAPFVARTYCSSCDVGKFSSKEGSINCTKCPVGYYQDDTASSACEACASGTYSHNKASVECVDCETGFNSAVGSYECDLAASGYYIDTNDDDSSKTCPSEATCAGGYELPKPKVNFWCNRKKLKTVTDFEKCARNTCTGGSGNASCWLPAFFSLDDDDADCDSDLLQCLEGSFGPLCGACSNGYTFSSSTSTCVLCNSSVNKLPLIITLSLLIFISVWVAIMIIYREKAKQLVAVKFFLSLSLVKLLGHVDMGMARVAWSTYQIISSISWNLNVTYPQPFRSLLSALSFLQLDFLSLDCVSGKANFYGRVYTMSIGPIIVVLFSVVVYFIRVVFMKDASVATIKSQHAYVFLLITYLVLPPVSMIHFQSLDCLKLSDGSSYLRSDTSISCDTKSYSYFAGFVGVFIFIYQSLPLLWLLLLWLNKRRIHPLSGSLEGRDPAAAVAVAIDSRSQDSKISYLRFLWDDYVPSKWYFEVVDMYRRILFIGVLPLLGTGSLRATIGCFFSILLAAYFREASPYVRNTTNILAVVAQYQILANFFGALVILSNSLAVFGLTDFGLGCVLLGANLIILLLCGVWCLERYRLEKETKKWRRILSTQENDILSKIMSDGTPRVDKSDLSGVKMVEQRSAELLEQYLLKPSDVILDKKIGAGAFGEVFKGTCLGEAVAIKTMIDVTEKNARSFRAEILLTATLRHPNIVNFVGACWDRELTCLVLEWVSGGSYQGLLEDVTQNLTWGDPLLRLTCDIARGMNWLHKRKHYDDREQKHFEGIIHRDLKPDNVLITEFMNGKITDFGTSRALSDEEMTMTAVGTPIFCAPEVMKGDNYDEKADVYAFGMSLMTMALEEPLLDFLRARWCVWNNKPKPPKQPMRMIRPMVEEGWRPVTFEDPIQFAPPSINKLLILCCDQDQTNRPSFEEIIAFLDTFTAEEVNRQNYFRYGVEGRTAALRKDKVELDNDNMDADVDMPYPTTHKDTSFNAPPIHKASSFAASVTSMFTGSVAAMSATTSPPNNPLNPLSDQERADLAVMKGRKSSLGMELTDIKSDPSPSEIVTVFTEI